MRTLSGVGRRYGRRGPWVLRDVDLAVPAGAVLRLQGANGSGKSTLLRLIAGIDAPSTGRITGRPRTAYVPERFAAALPFHAQGYLTHLGRIHGLTGPQAARQAAHWLERFAITGCAGTPLEQLSKGTAQKVAVAQALLAEPELLVLDEAWTGLDQRARSVLDAAVAERVGAGGTVAFVDHDPQRLAGAASAVYEVAGGRLTAAGAGAAAVVLIEAEGPGEPPAGLPPYRRTGPAAIRITAPAAASDAVLRILLGAEPPWHIRALRPGSPLTPEAR